MKKLFDKIRKNNKAFTLVELIIVIAVMAILTVVVAPQYLKYIEKSRVATDENAIGELKHIVEVTYIEAAADDIDDYEVKIIIDDAGVFEYDSNASDKRLDELVAEIYPEGSYDFKSKTYKEQEITFTVNPDTGLADHNDPNGAGGGGAGGGGAGGGGEEPGGEEPGGDPTSDPCTICQSTEHTTENHPTPDPCTICQSTEHTTENHPAPDPCSYCQSTEHTTENHPRCTICQDPEHTTENHPRCTICQDPYHTTENHPRCEHCQSTEHTTAQHPTCPKCGSTEHTTHPAYCDTHKGNNGNANKGTTCKDPYCGWWNHRCYGHKHGNKDWQHCQEDCEQYCNTAWSNTCKSSTHSKDNCEIWCDKAWRS